MTEYMVRPKSMSKIKWDGYHRACLGVSLGNSNERGEKFLSIVNWFNSKFDEVIIDLSDALYRWNEYDNNGHLAVDAKEQAIAKGDQWIVENRASLSAFTIPYKIIRWNTWLKHPDFFATQHQIRKLYNSHGNFSHNINMDIQKFMDRRKSLGLEVTPAVIQNCLNFIIEELAVHSILFKSFPNTMQVYPGDEAQSMRAIRQGLIAESPVGLQGVPFVSLRVERAADYQLQASTFPLTA